MSDETAYQTSHPEVIAAYDQWVEATREVSRNRLRLSEMYGRGLFVNRLGFGHGTRITGFERFDSDVDGDLLADGALIVSTERGQYNGLIVPNMKRKAGKEFHTHLREYNSPVLDLPGMPGWHLAGAGNGDGLRSYSPGIFKQDGHVLAFWACDDAPVDLTYWEQIKLSHYYSVKEKHDAEASSTY